MYFDRESYRRDVGSGSQSVERTELRRQGVHQPCRHGGDVCAAVWRHPAHQQEYRAVHLLPADRDSGRPAQGPPAGNHRHHVGELPVHPAGHTGTGLCGDPGSGDRAPSWCSASIATAPARCRSRSTCRPAPFAIAIAYQRLPPGDFQGASEEPSPAAGVGGDHLLRGEHRLDRSRDRAHRTQVHQEDLGGMLLLVVPVLPGGRRLCRNDRLVQPRVWMGNFAADRSHHLPDLPVLSAVSGKT